MPVTIFFCYARKDKALLNELKTHLRPLQRQGIIEVWDDGAISAGTEWEQEIAKHLDAAQVILLLVSPDFMNSDYCYSVEMKRAIERHERKEAHIIPVIVDHVYWQIDPLSKLQALPTDGKPVMSNSWQSLNEALFDVTVGIHKVVQQLTQKHASDWPIIAETIQPKELHVSSRVPIAGATLPKEYDNLPPLRGEFLGREKEKARVLNSLRSRSYLISIEGLGGVGKTTLAIEVARSCLVGPQAVLDPPFEYVVWVSARDRPEQKLWLNEVLDTTARVLGYPSLMKLSVEQIEQKKAEANQLLHAYRTLLIIDNFETIDDCALESWIQDIPDPSKVLITSRTSQLRNTRPIDLKGLEDPAALELIRHSAGSLGLETLEAASQETLFPLVRVTGGNPKAIGMALGYIKRGRLSLNEVIEHLHVAGRTVNTVFDDLFARAWNVMTRNAQDVLLVVPFFVDYASKEALGATTGLTAYYLDNAVEELVELKLLDIKEASVAMNQRYSIHPLTRAFASAQRGKILACDRQTRKRWSEYYLNLAIGSLTRNELKESYWNALPPYNRELIDPEWLNLQEVLAWADREGQDQILVDLMLLLTHYMWACMFFSARLYYAQKAAEAAGRLGRKDAAALLYIDARGWILLELGRLTDGIEDIYKGLRLAQTLEASRIEATELVILANAFLARAFLEQGNLAEASALLDKVISLECWPITQQHISITAGDIAYRKNNFLEAREFYKNADRISIRHGGEGGDIRLGNAYLADGDLTQAEAYFKEAFNRWQHLAVDRIPYAQYGLARVALAKGERDKARQMAEAVLDDLVRTAPSHKLTDEIRNLLKGLEDMLE